MTTDVVITIVASDEGNVNKIEPDCGFAPIVSGRSVLHREMAIPQPTKELIPIGDLRPISTLHRGEIILEVWEIRLRQSYQPVKLWGERTL
jgi:hypothetical protein